MAERKYTHGLEISMYRGMPVLSIGTMEIWDGADLSLVRDTIFRLVREDDIESVGIDANFVQHVPSGFFGMMYDWHDRGLSVYLINPRERVKQMLWFRKFFSESEPGIFSIYNGQGIDENISEELWTPIRNVESKRLPVLSR